MARSDIKPGDLIKRNAYDVLFLVLNTSHVDVYAVSILHLDPNKEVVRASYPLGLKLFVRREYISDQHDQAAWSIYCSIQGKK